MPSLWDRLRFALWCLLHRRPPWLCRHPKWAIVSYYSGNPATARRGCTRCGKRWNTTSH